MGLGSRNEKILDSKEGKLRPSGQKVWKPWFCNHGSACTADQALADYDLPRALLVMSNITILPSQLRHGDSCQAPQEEAVTQS